MENESTQTPDFEVVVIGQAPGSLDDWSRALRAPSSELEGLLSEGDKEFARRFGIAEEEYARGRLLRTYSDLRIRERGIALGRTVNELAKVLGPDYKLKALVFEGAKPRWVIRMETPRGTVGVAVSTELADDVIDSSTIQDQEALRKLLLTSLGRGELIRG